MLSERKRRILCAIVEQYNRTGEPVGSKRLMELLPDAVSSATIRNEMAQLGELGYLEQPHTSAGRVPSRTAYRYYIDHLLPGRELSTAQRVRLEERLLEHAREPENLLENVGRLLAELTNCTALYAAPGGADIRVKRLEMTPVSGHMAMVALLTTHGAVKSRVIRTESPIGEELRALFYRVSRESILDRPLEELTQGYMQSLAAKTGAHLLTMACLLATVAELACESAGREVLVEEANSLRHPEMERGAARLLRDLRAAIAAERLRESLWANDVQVILGAETPWSRGAHDISLILCSYAVGDSRGGLLGILGPVRLDYARVIPCLRTVTALVGRMLTAAIEE